MGFSVEHPPTAVPSCSYTTGRSAARLRGVIAWVEDFSPDQR